MGAKSHNIAKPFVNVSKIETGTDSHISLLGNALNISAYTYFAYPLQARASIARRRYKPKCMCTHSPGLPFNGLFAYVKIGNVLLAKQDKMCT